MIGALVGLAFVGLVVAGGTLSERRQRRRVRVERLAANLGVRLVPGEPLDELERRIALLGGRLFR